MKNTHSASAVPVRFRRQVTSLLLVLSLSIGTIVAIPTPAHAASYVQGNFSMNGFFPTPGCFCQSDIAGATVKLMYSFDGSSWYPGGSATLNALGRYGFSVNPGFQNAYIAMRVDHPAGYFLSPWLFFFPGAETSVQRAMVTRY